MEIKLNVLQTLLNMVRFMENMELETAVLLVVFLLLTPFAVGSLWTVGVAVACQMFWLGVKAGILLFVVCGMCLAGIRFTNPHLNKYAAQRGFQCTIMDAFLSVLFQAGFRIPTCIWDRLVKKVDASGQNRTAGRMLLSQQQRKKMARVTPVSNLNTVMEEDSTDEVEGKLLEDSNLPSCLLDASADVEDVGTRRRSRGVTGGGRRNLRSKK